MENGGAGAAGMGAVGVGAGDAEGAGVAGNVSLGTIGVLPCSRSPDMSKGAVCA